MPEIIDKNTLRKKMKQKRNALTWEERERAAEDCLRQLKQVPGFEQVTWMYCYMSYLSELDTRQMIQSFLKEGKRVAVPKVRYKTFRHAEMPLEYLWARYPCRRPVRSPIRHAGMPLEYL